VQTQQFPLNRATLREQAGTLTASWRSALSPPPQTDPSSEEAAMHCYVYASQRKADTYLWMSQRDMFDALPESLLLLLGELRFVLEVELSGQRKLPQEDIEQVLENLRQQGWHLQLPPTETLAVANHLAYRTTPPASSDEDGR
jgi:uncharacterized protein YcgL (UPF0745 family)